MNNEKRTRRPQGGPPMMRTVEKAKDFKGSIIRLFKELGSFKIIILFAIVLAVISSILSIYAPNKLTSLTDEITKGLVVNNKNLEKLNSELQNNAMSNSFNSIYIDDIEITSNDQIETISIMSSLNKEMTSKELYHAIEKLPTNVKEVIKPKMNIDRVREIVLFLAIIYIISALSSFIQSLLMATVSNKFAKKLRESISKKINKLPLKFFDKNRSGDILSRVTNDVDTVAQSMNQSLASLVSNIVLFIGTLLMMIITNYILALTAVLSTIFGFIGMSFILKKSQKYFKDRQKELGKLNSHIEEAYSGLTVVKLYNAKEESKKEFDKLNKKVKEANFKSQFLSGIMMPLMNFVGNFGYVSVCIVGAILTMKGMITFGVIVAFITYIRMFTNPLSQIAQSVTSLQSSAAAAERIFEFMDEKEMPEENHLSTHLNRDEVKGDIEFSNIEFTYDGNSEPTIKNFSATVKSGQKIAIVGKTGAGKTTMVNLLMKFYDINKGSIKIDNVDIKDLKRENVHDLFTMVLQDTWLFEDSIRSNIVFNRKNVSDEKIRSVCKQIGLDYFIKALPNGYDSLLGESDSLSSGQKQLLTIARAMIDETPFLILDEATSNVDTRTEELVSKAMDELTKGRTSFIIAHRLSTIKNADLILVMDNGNIIEQGNHKELMKKKGVYADLYNSQFEL